MRTEIPTSSTTKAWAENLLLTSAIPTVGILITPSDPFFIDAPFPWVLLPLLLLALRYGTNHGTVSLLLLATAYEIGLYIGYWEPTKHSLSSLAIGMLLIIFICGEFHEIYERRMHALQIKYSRQNARMNEFVPLYQLLKSSHAQLERKLGGRFMSLRKSLQELQSRILTFSLAKGPPLEGIAMPILDFFCFHTSTRSAALYSINIKGQLMHPAMACFGNPRPVWPTNHLLREVLRTRQVVSIQPDHYDTVDGTLSIVPLIDVDDKIWAVIVINEMSLFDFNHQTLTLLAVLGGRIGDLIRRRNSIFSLSECSIQTLDTAIRRADYELREFKLPSAIIAITVPPHNQDDACGKLLGGGRGSDEVWCIKRYDGCQILIRLLHFTDEQALASFLSRNGILDSLSASSTLVSSVTWCLTPEQCPESLLAEITATLKIPSTPIQPSVEVDKAKSRAEVD
ncbi:hypothetical protein [Methyloterricola oryzae]|uniref:hypothetical protein n=1 Tax=Methyloterricola oryzae TaxID=1495050 RepID=UPI0005EAFBD7|nr:hypothetical protein [Methyloterricola oryzae]